MGKIKAGYAQFTVYPHKEVKKHLEYCAAKHGWAVSQLASYILAEKFGLLGLTPEEYRRMKV